MKHIFENLKAILERHKEKVPVIVTAQMLAEIDEAKTSWEKDSCVWVWRIENGRKTYRNCLYKADTHITYSFKYCPYCGKTRKEEIEQ